MYLCFRCRYNFIVKMLLLFNTYLKYEYLSICQSTVSFLKSL
jgi:hypothetical protein